MAARSEYLLPALLEQVSRVRVPALDRELAKVTKPARLSYLAGFGLRGELLFPTTCILESKPALLAYYRLLLGFSQKEFYTLGPFGMFFSMESRGAISPKAKQRLPALCVSLSESAWLLANAIPALSQEMFDALTLLTLGSQWRGSYITALGQRATRDVFAAIKTIVEPAIEVDGETSLVIRNAAGRRVRIDFAADPDITIREELAAGGLNNKIAIEIKGGRDRSNIHNRLGEAEKSHQKASAQGFRHLWTLLNVASLDPSVAQRESPTTTRFYLIDRILDPTTPEYADFRAVLISELGLRDRPIRRRKDEGVRPA